MKFVSLTNLVTAITDPTSMVCLSAQLVCDITNRRTLAFIQSGCAGKTPIVVENPDH